MKDTEYLPYELEVKSEEVKADWDVGTEEWEHAIVYTARLFRISNDKYKIRRCIGKWTSPNRLYAIHRAHLQAAQWAHDEWWDEQFNQTSLKLESFNYDTDNIPKGE